MRNTVKRMKGQIWFEGKKFENIHSKELVSKYIKNS